MRERRFFVYMAASVYYFISKEVQNRIFRHNCIFSLIYMYKQPILAKQQNHNIFVQILHSQLRCTDMLFEVFFLLLAVILSELHKIQDGKIEFQKRVNRRTYVEDITFTAALPSSYVIFCCFLCVFPSPSQVMYLLKGSCKDA